MCDVRSVSPELLCANLEPVALGGEPQEERRKRKERRRRKKRRTNRKRRERERWRCVMLARYLRAVRLGATLSHVQLVGMSALAQC